MLDSFDIWRRHDSRLARDPQDATLDAENGLVLPRARAFCTGHARAELTREMTALNFWI